MLGQSDQQRAQGCPADRPHAAHNHHNKRHQQKARIDTQRHGLRCRPDHTAQARKGRAKRKDGGGNKRHIDPAGRQHLPVIDPGAHDDPQLGLVQQQSQRNTDSNRQRDLEQTEHGVAPDDRQFGRAKQHLRREEAEGVAAKDGKKLVSDDDGQTDRHQCLA